MNPESAAQLKKERLVNPRLFVAIMAHKYELGRQFNRKIEFIEGFERFVDEKYEAWSQAEASDIMKKQLADAQARGVDPVTYAEKHAQQFRREIDDPATSLIKIEKFQVTDPTGLHLRPLASILHLTQAAPNADLYLGRPLRPQEPCRYDFTWESTAFFQIKADSIFRTIEQLAVPFGTPMQAWAWGLEAEITQFFKGLYANLQVRKME